MPDPSALAVQRKAVAVLYGASASHARVISQRVAEDLRGHGYPAESHNLQDLAGFDLSRCVAAVFLAPVPMGDDEKALVDFVKTHRPALERLPAAFLSLAQSKVAAERREDAQERQARLVDDTRKLLDRFFSETGWSPARVHPLAGAVSYTRYHFLVRWAMKLLAGKSGPTPDPSREDWGAVDDFVNDFVQEIRAASPPWSESSEAKPSG
jgi:menaquinone-dependent protoporphyrinogen oxidase